MASNIAFPPSNYQTQSPLFGILPGEVRNEIFALALLQYEDDAGAYPEDSYWYRPGFFGPRKCSSGLLRTCKLAHTEGQQVFLKQLEWAFWFDRGPKGRTGSKACERFFQDLAPGVIQALQKVRFFTQMYWLESGDNLNNIFSVTQFRPTVLTITIRYSDWWYWEYNCELVMDEDWLRCFSGNPGLKQLKVEYETLSWKKEEMMRIIHRNKSWKLPIRREGGAPTDYDGYLSAEHSALDEWKWNGPSKLDGQTWSHHGPGETIEYVVVTDTWNFVEGPMSEEDISKRAELIPGSNYSPDDPFYDPDNEDWDYGLSFLENERKSDAASDTNGGEDMGS